MADEKEKEKKEYLVREGRTFGVANLGAGESVFLTEEEATPFLDILEPRTKPRKSDQSADTRDTAKNEENIGNKDADKGTVRSPAKK
jgi:hypothetical protein